jgi:branched-chain amino acid transport system ATP-binding protein
MLDTIQPLLKVENLNSWYGESHILHGVNIDIYKGETVTLLGRNGAGKTTTLRSVMGVIRKRTGKIQFQNTDLMKLPQHLVAHQGIGYVPEERGIFASLSVDENLLLPPSVAKNGTSVEEIYQLFPNLLERKNSPGTKLSGGEQQMLAIARILRTGARFILLDEPTEGLAPVIVERIGEIILKLKSEGYTILLVEQNFRFAAKLADRHYVMEDGKVVDHIRADELTIKSAALHKFLGV